MAPHRQAWLEVRSVWCLSIGVVSSSRIVFKNQWMSAQEPEPMHQTCSPARLLQLAFRLEVAETRTTESKIQSVVSIVISRSPTVCLYLHRCLTQHALSQTLKQNKANLETIFAALSVRNAECTRVFYKTVCKKNRNRTPQTCNSIVTGTSYPD